MINGFYRKLNRAKPLCDSVMSENPPAAPIHDSWRALLDAEFAKSYMADLRAYLAHRKTQRVVVYPHSSQWFNAFGLTPVDSVKVVILGQDPYHKAGQAHGLSFSVPAGVALPPSLLNIYKEIDTDVAREASLVARRAGCLENWARQGVFLLNSVLTVEQGQAAAHQGRGWETFTDAVVKYLSDERDDLVFLLWGSYAQKKGQVIDAKRHRVLRAPHPSPLSAHRGFFGCAHFSQANQWLEEKGQTPIDWHDVF